MGVVVLSITMINCWHLRQESKRLKNRRTDFILIWKIKTWDFRGLICRGTLLTKQTFIAQRRRQIFYLPVVHAPTMDSGTVTYP